MTYQFQKKYDQAEILHLRCLNIFEKVLGPTNPRAATVLNNLASLYFSERRYAEAEPLYRKAMAIEEANFGPEYHGLAEIMSNYSLLLKKTQRKSEASAMMSQAQKIASKDATNRSVNQTVCLHDLTR